MPKLCRIWRFFKFLNQILGKVTVITRHPGLQPGGERPGGRRVRRKANLRTGEKGAGSCDGGREHERERGTRKIPVGQERGLARGGRRPKAKARNEGGGARKQKREVRGGGALNQKRTARGGGALNQSPMGLWAVVTLHISLVFTRFPSSGPSLPRRRARLWGGGNFLGFRDPAPRNGIRLAVG